MIRKAFAALAGPALLGLLLLPGTASAQSAISGVVRDSSEAVLPGVTIEISSPALIEKVRDRRDGYSGPLRRARSPPGVYKVTFALTGFRDLHSGGTSSCRRTSLPPSTREHESRSAGRVGHGVGAVAGRRRAERSADDGIAARSARRGSRAAHVSSRGQRWRSGTKVSDQNVGGARSAVNPRLTAHERHQGHDHRCRRHEDEHAGRRRRQPSGSQRRHDPGNHRADRRPRRRGVRPAVRIINLIPSEGGNSFSGATFIGYTDSSFQSDNLTARAPGAGAADARLRRYDLRRRTSRSAARSSRTSCGSSARIAMSATTTSWPTAFIRTAARRLRPARPELHGAADVAGIAKQQVHDLQRLPDEVRRPRLHLGRWTSRRPPAGGPAARVHGRGEMDLDSDRQAAVRRWLRRQRQSYTEKYQPGILKERRSRPSGTPTPAARTSRSQHDDDGEHAGDLHLQLPLHDDRHRRPTSPARTP